MKLHSFSHPPLEFADLSNGDETFIDSLLESPFYQFAIESKCYDNSKGLIEYKHIIYDNQKRFIGYVKYYISHPSQQLWIQIFVVNEAFSRQSYGTFIFHELLAQINDHYSINQIYLTCHQDNVAGRCFWESLGFIKIHTIKSTHSLYRADTRSLTCIKNPIKL